MKIRSISFFWLILAIATLSGCFKPPEFPNEPEIEFSNIVFKPGGDNGDSLILSFDFQDGNGDIGLSGSEDDFPYHPFNIIVDANGDTVFFSDEDLELPLFMRAPNGSLTMFSETDNRTPFNCQEYEFLRDPITNVTIDTFYIAKNPNNLNIRVDFFKKVGENYVFFDWTNVASNNRCGEDFNGRFPIFDDTNFRDSKPLAGTIDYSMVSVGFIYCALRGDVFKIDITIKDRALNTSNTVSTPDVTLQDITVN